MTQTRAAAARLAEIASRHPQSLQAFTEGVGSILRQWTALELAVHHQWGGPTSATRADELVKEIVDLFSGPDKVYKDDIELLLEDYMEMNFNTICEDDSPTELGDMFCTMWRQCITGDFTLVTNALSREYIRHEMVSKSQGLDGGDADDGSDDGEEMAMSESMLAEAVRETMTATSSTSIGQSSTLSAIPESSNESGTLSLGTAASGISIPTTVFTGAIGTAATMASIGEDGAAMEEEQCVPAVPLVDEDGFETVVRGKKANKKQSKRA
mmetsp:Transcript_8199/g.13613  ORF Transcript_8199/g.13613 Transcript_8199/m.13613 type:complete len:269 (+) Transcript_8199:65-871(+)